jgi:putative ABC transport system permease protein
VLFAGVGIVLLIACTNISCLLLSRAATRRKEMSLRTALGAGRGRLVRQLLTESVLLAAIGAGWGVLLGTVALRTFKSVLPSDIPGLAAIGMDWQIVGFVAALAVLTGLAFGLAPALSASQVDLAGSMKTGTARSTTTTWTRLRGFLIVGEVALTVVLVVSAGLLLKSLYQMDIVNPGFRPENILTMRISPDQALCKQRDACIALYGRLRDQVRGISGISEVAVANTIPLDGQIPELPYDVEGHPKSADFPAPMLWTGAVTPDYFQLLNIPLLAGRRFTSNDVVTSGGVVILSAATARRFWPNESALGKHLKPAWDSQWRTVVGVVGDVRQFTLAGRTPEGLSGSIYMPYPQAAQADHNLPASMDLLIKTNEPPARLSGEIREMVREVTPNVPLSPATALQDAVINSTSDFRATILVFLSFAAAALILAAAGIYGLVSNSVAQRTFEIGVRVAIGASRTEILRLILVHSLRLSLVGVAVGILVALAVTRFLTAMLFGVTSTDPLTFGAVCLLLLAVAAAASFVPAWSAANLDPIRSLRAE